MNRRDFIIGTGLGAVWPGSKRLTASAATTAGKAGILTGGHAEKIVRAFISERAHLSSPGSPASHRLSVPRQ
jgi:hypothetical protein